MYKRISIMLILLVFVLPAFGQNNASLQGIVTDNTGAGIPNAMISLTNQSTGITNKAISSDHAEFRFLYLPVGNYTLTCEAPGFKRYQQALPLDVGQAGYLAIKLEVGGATSSVTVTAEEPLLESTTGDRGLVIDHQLVTEIPVVGHSAIMQSGIVPGVTYAGGASQRPFDNGGTGNWVINGGSSYRNEFMMDGAPDNGYTSFNFAAFMPTPDVVQETKIITNVYDAEYGKTGGGIITFSTKSGANALHGAAYEYMQRTGWQANSYANKYANHARTPSTIDQFGGVFSGPVIIPKFYSGSNRTFFLFNYDGYRSSIPRSVTASVPAPEFSNGDFSKYVDGKGALIPIYDWANVVNGQRQQFSYNGTPNVIPPGRLDPVAKKILSYYAKPNFTTPGSAYSINDFYDSPTEQNPYNSILFRIDHDLSSSSRIYFRHLWSRYQQHSANGSNGTYNAPGENVQYMNRNNEGDVLNWNWAFNARSILDLTLSYNRYEEYNSNPANYGVNPTTFGLSQGVTGQLPSQNYFGTFSFSQYAALGAYDTYKFTNTPAILPQMTMILGKHTLKVGADLRLMTWTIYNPNTWGMSATNGITLQNYAQSNNLSGNAIASFLLGGASSNATYNPHGYYTIPYAAIYVQDAWRVNRRLTFNLGLRDDIIAGATERYNRVNAGFNSAVVNPAATVVSASLYPNLVPRLVGGLQFAGTNGVSRDVWPTTARNFQPRLGVAYQITPKLVARGGWGRIYINPDYYTNLQSMGYTQQTSYTASGDNFNTLNCEPGVSTGPCFLENPFPNGIAQAPGSSLGYATYEGQGFSYMTGDWKPSHVDQFSAGFQYQMPLSSILDISYVGSRSRNLVSSRNANNVPLSVRQQCDPYEGGNPTWCQTNVANPFQGLQPFFGSSLYSSATTTNNQLSLQYPEFGGLTEVGRHDDSMWFNSGQVVWRANLKNRLTANINYVYSKQMMTGYSANYSSGNSDFLDPIKMILNRSVYEGDQTHRFNASLVYQLPFGRGQVLLGNTNQLVNRLVSGFQVSPWFSWASGMPWQLPNAILLDNPHLSTINWSDKTVQFVKNCVGVWNNNGTITPTSSSTGCSSFDWLVPPTYAPRVLPYLDPHVRLHTTPLVNAALSKTTPINDHVSLQLRAEAFNATNTQNSAGNSPDGGLTNATFGKLVRTSGAVNARTIQLTGKIVW